ncbi:MAG: glycoside hydrolase family 2 protein [Gemmatimonadaceae bacterium]
MRRLPVLLFLAVAATSTAAQEPAPAGLIVNPDGRSATSLDGAWHAIVDPYETGYYDYRLKPSRNGWFRNYKAKTATDLVEYDFDRSPTLTVPGDWNTQRPELLLYEGAVWYKQSFTRALAPGRRLFVYFGGANYATRAWLNGVELGFHEGGFTPFDFEVTKLLRDGAPNDLVVMVGAQRRRDAVPMLNADWWNYGGITRSVMLVETPATFVRDYVVQLDRHNPQRIRGYVQLDAPPNAPTTATRVTVRIPDARLTSTVTTGANGRAELSLDASKLTRWSPDAPNVHDVQVITGTDTVHDRIGFRTIETRGHQILLNGKPIFLRGIAMHEESLGSSHRIRDVGEQRALFSLARELGANFVRLAHYPYMEQTPRLADEMGLLVWEELPVYWTIEFENPATLANAKNQLEEMVTRDRNRASIAFWSVANETPRDTAPGGGPRLAFLRAMIDRAHALDDTRLVTAALEHRYVDPTTIMIDDPLGGYLDVLGNNEYLGWYDQPLSKAERITWKTPYDKPLVMSELGGGAKAGLHGSADSLWTEEYQEKLYRAQVAMLQRIPFLAGVSPWVLKDFRSPRRPLTGIQDYFNRKGLVSDSGAKKKAFFVLQQWYRVLAADSVARH